MHSTLSYSSPSPPEDLSLSTSGVPLSIAAFIGFQYTSISSYQYWRLLFQRLLWKARSLPHNTLLCFSDPRLFLYCSVITHCIMSCFRRKEQ